MKGIIKHNLNGTSFESVALNLHDMHDYSGAMKKFIPHIKEKEGADSSALKRYFRFEDKFVWLTPFSYSADREKTGGFNNEDSYLLHSRHKVDVSEYYSMACEWGADFVVSPCEQVTNTSGRKKRRRSLKAAAKHANKLAKLLKETEEQEPIPLLASVVLGDESGLDNYEMRHYIRNVLQGEDGAQP